MTGSDEEPDAEQGDRPRDAEEGQPAAKDWETKRRLAEIFGDVLPSTTSDDRDESGQGESGSEAWLRRQVPPHHGGH